MAGESVTLKIKKQTDRTFSVTSNLLSCFKDSHGFVKCLIEAFLAKHLKTHEPFDSFSKANIDDQKEVKRSFKRLGD